MDLDELYNAGQRNIKESSSYSALVRQGLGAVQWGMFFTIAPVYQMLVVFPFVWIGILTWREVVRTRKYGFRPGFAVRSGIVVIMLVTGIVMSDIYYGRTIEPLPKEEYNFEELRTALEFRGIGISYPKEKAKSIIYVPEKAVSMRSFISKIEEQTVTRHHFGYTGNSLSVLWGGKPWGGLFFELDEG